MGFNSGRVGKTHFKNGSESPCVAKPHTDFCFLERCKDFNWSDIQHIVCAAEIGHIAKLMVDFWALSEYNQYDRLYRIRDIIPWE